MTTGGFLTQPLKRAAQLAPEGLATIDGPRRRNWAEVLARVRKLAGGLRALGIAPGDRVAVLALNSDRYFELHFALPWIGAALVPLNTRLAPAEIAFMLADCAAEVILVDEAHRAVIEQNPQVAALLRTVIVMGERAVSDGNGRVIDYEHLIETGPAIEDQCPGGAHMAGIFYTSGSSGRAKGVVLSHDNLLTNAMNAILGIGYDGASRYLHAAPMFHLTDGMSTYSLTMVLGTHVFIPKFDARAVLDAVQAHRITHLCLVPTMIEMLISLAESERFDLSSLKQFQFGSAPMPDATLARAVALWPDMLFLHGWGMTEISPLGTMLPHEWRRPQIGGARLRSCGVPMVNEEIRIVDANGADVPQGEVGEMIVRGPMVMQGYWNMPEETARTIRNGWLHTGDAAYRDAEGLIYIVDRLKDMIISGGENIYSTEVENVIGRCDGVAHVAVIGLPHPKWGESVHAVIIPKDGAVVDTDAITRYLRTQIAGYKVPRSFSIRSAPMPLTSTGKVSKRTLREEYRTLAAS